MRQGAPGRPPRLSWERFCDLLQALPPEAAVWRAVPSEPTDLVPRAQIEEIRRRHRSRIGLPEPNIRHRGVLRIVDLEDPGD